MTHALVVAFLTVVLVLPAPAMDAPWALLGELNMDTGAVSDALSSVVKEPMVTVRGFIVPLEMEDTIDYVSEFLLVPDPMACIHVPPPPPNQMIMVTMPHAIPLDMDYRGVAVQGKLRITESDGVFSYALAGVHAEEATVEYDDPLKELLGF